MIFINTQDSHYKFWGYSSKSGSQNHANPYWGHTVTTYWGRIGQSLKTCQSKDFDFSTRFEAERFIQQKLDEKRRKGYEPCSNYEALVSKNSDMAGSFDDLLIDLKDNIDAY